MTKHWFCDDPEGEGYTTFATEAEALAEAAACIEGWKGYGNEWPEEIYAITVGRVMYVARQIKKMRCVEGCHEAHDYHCEVAMRPISMPKEPIQEPAPCSP